MSQVANGDDLSTGEDDLALVVGYDLFISSEECHKTYILKVVFQNQGGAGRAYTEALAKAQHMELNHGVFKTSGTVGTALKTLLGLASRLSELDPTGRSKVAFVICTKAWEYTEKQEKQAAELDNLVQSLARMTPTVESVQRIADANLGNTVTAMLNLIEDASLLTLNCKSRNTLAQTLYSIVDWTAHSRIQDFVQRLRNLREELDRVFA
ncbi:hypothetical protein FRC08_000537 [Ceratobasidium sp. 394]|nr:hypothetical protein FRC08_000537 [Ceratobasidium sp. 394]